MRKRENTVGKHTRKTELWEIQSILNVNTRRWLYGVATAVIPLLIAYGVLAEHTAPLWLALASNVLATGVAFAHTPKEGKNVVVADDH